MEKISEAHSQHLGSILPLTRKGESKTGRLKGQEDVSWHAT